MFNELSLARLVASFYWQLAGRVWQDIPLDEKGRATEFERYVGYFILKTPRFQGPLANILREMAVITYIESVRKGDEPRAYLRKASRKASALSRRSKPLSGLDPEHVCPQPADEKGTFRSFDISGDFNLRDVIEALTLDNNSPLVDYLLDEIIQARSQTSTDKATFLENLVKAGSNWLRPETGLKVSEFALDRTQALKDVLKAWTSRLKKHPGTAFNDVIRELKILPRMVPAPLFLAVSSALALISLYQGFSGVDSTAKGTLAIAVAIALLFAVDMLSYIVHVERDGWGDGAEARAFQDHHDFPDEAGRWTVGRSVSSTAPVVIPLLLVLVLTQPHFSVAIGGAVALMGLLFLTQTHGLAHVDDSNLAVWIKTLQKFHIILPKKPHDHHHETLTGSYGVFNGWSNAFMNKIGYRTHYTRLRMLCGGDTPIWVRQLAERAQAPILKEAATR
jgi:hypothetical protein